VERWNALAGYRGLKDPAVRRYFNGTFLAFEKDWAGNEELRMTTLGLPYEVLYLGGDAAADAIQQRLDEGLPALFYLWSPHPFNARYSLNRIQLPAYNPAHFEQGLSDYPVDVLEKLAYTHTRARTHTYARMHARTGQRSSPRSHRQLRSSTRAFRSTTLRRRPCWQILTLKGCLQGKLRAHGCGRRKTCPSGSLGFPLRSLAAMLASSLLPGTTRLAANHVLLGQHPSAACPRRACCARQVRRPPWSLVTPLCASLSPPAKPLVFAISMQASFNHKRNSTVASAVTALGTSSRILKGRHPAKLALSTRNAIRSEGRQAQTKLRACANMVTLPPASPSALPLRPMRLLEISSALPQARGSPSCISTPELLVNCRILSPSAPCWRGTGLTFSWSPPSVLRVLLPCGRFLSRPYWEFGIVCRSVAHVRPRLPPGYKRSSWVFCILNVAFAWVFGVQVLLASPAMGRPRNLFGSASPAPLLNSDSIPLCPSSRAACVVPDWFFCRPPSATRSKLLANAAHVPCIMLLCTRLVSRNRRRYS
jgi:hypothetical protein